MDVKNFDATSIPPQQMGDKHPVGMFPVQISNTYGKANDKTPGGQLVVEFQSAAGTVANRYNLWNQSEAAVEIAKKELSALCHATGVFKLSFEGLDPKDYARELRGARCTINVGLQDTTKPDGYVEVKKVFDINGNEPGKAPSSAPQPQQGGWGGGATQQQPPANNAPPANSGGWQPQQTTQPQQGGWQPGPSNPPANQGGVNQPPWVK